MKPGKNIYYTLIASLPFLPRFDQARRLPITLERLEARMSMLALEDAEASREAMNFLWWSRQPVERTDNEVISFYKHIMTSVHQPTLRNIIQFQMTLRTILAALRQRHRKLAIPSKGKAWGIAPWVAHIERNWNEDNFKLSPIFPWVPEVRQLLEAEETLELQKYIMQMSWNYLDQLAEGQYFTFDVFLTYLFKWDLLNRWVLYNTPNAIIRFEKLTMETLGEYNRVFA